MSLSPLRYINYFFFFIFFSMWDTILTITCCTKSQYDHACKSITYGSINNTKGHIIFEKFVYRLKRIKRLESINNTNQILYIRVNQFKWDTLIFNYISTQETWALYLKKKKRQYTSKVFSFFQLQHQLTKKRRNSEIIGPQRSSQN